MEKNPPEKLEESVSENPSLGSPFGFISTWRLVCLDKLCGYDDIANEEELLDYCPACVGPVVSFPLFL